MVICKNERNGVSFGMFRLRPILKTHSLLVSRRHSPFDISRIHFMLKRFIWDPVREVKEMKLVSFILDNKWTFEPMLNHDCIPEKVDPSSVLYSISGTTWILPILRSFTSILFDRRWNMSILNIYPQPQLTCLSWIKFKLQQKGSVVFKLNHFPPHASKREVSLIGFLFKLLDGDGRGEFNTFTQCLAHTTPRLPQGMIPRPSTSKTVSILETLASKLIGKAKRLVLFCSASLVHILYRQNRKAIVFCRYRIMTR